MLCLAACSIALQAQLPQPTPPRQEKLLNGLKVLMWSDQKADNVSLRVRIHSGSAFDPQGKEGVMRLLKEHIFPTADAREFFTDELGGTLDVISNYDYIEIDATSKPDRFLNLVETVANAVNNLNIDKDSVAKLRSEQIERVKQLEADPAYVADRAAAARLLGTFPYGRPENGTLESLAKIDFADVLFAKQRFFTADNATVAIYGNFDPSLAFRALRRYFGNWLKADKKIPTAFTQPDQPDTKLLSVRSEKTGATQNRYALRGLARNDKDFAASQVLSRILEARLSAVVAKENVTWAFVRNQPHVLPGLILMGYSAGSDPSLPNVVSQVFAQPISEAEFSKYRSEVVSEAAKRDAADWWLDADTFKITSVPEDARAFDAMTLFDVQRVADRLSRNPVASVSLVSSPANNSN
jgi:predicted Zn-dependent peptidase